MSKAFTREDDNADDDDLDLEPKLPVGTKNYITPGGEAKLRAELKDLLYRARPELTEVVRWAASNGDRSENADYIYGKKRLREMDRRIRFLTKRLESAEVVDPTKVADSAVRFGATVVIRDHNGDEKTYRIVGVDEIDVKQGRISWISPLGSALLKARPGESVSYQSPKGSVEVEVVSVRYVPIL